MFDNQLFNFELVQILMRLFATCANIQSTVSTSCSRLIGARELSKNRALISSQLSSTVSTSCLLFKGRGSLHDWDGVPSNANKTSDNKTTVKNGHLEPSKETFGRVNRGFYDDVATNANASEDSSAEGQ